MVALDSQVRKQLHSEGLTELEVPCIATNASSWEQRYRSCPSSGPCDDPFAQVELPVMLDAGGGVFYIYSADSYHMILVDKQGRLAAKEICSGDCSVEIQRVKQRLRELYAE